MGRRTGRLNGRPKGSSSLLTKARTLQICRMLEIAMPEKYAAEANGVSDRTFRDWMSKGAEGIAPYAGFHAAVSRARARGMLNMLVRALKGGKGSGAAMWTLERRYPEEYGPRFRVVEKSDVKITIEGGLPKFPSEDESLQRKVVAFERIKQNDVLTN
jgi:hypothetical protein